MRKLNKIKATYTTLSVLPLAISLTACQSAVSQPETQPESSFAGTAQQETSPGSLPETAETAADNSDADSEPILIYTGIQATVSEHDADYPYYAELEKYLDDKQFVLMRIAHNSQAELYEGDETLEWDAQDWDLVYPLGQISYYDCGYGKIDYDNDGTPEIFYRTIDSAKRLTATLYQTDDAAEQITAECDFLDMFHDTLPQEGTVQQLWFRQFGENIVTFRLLRLRDSEEFVLCSDLVTADTDKKTTRCTRLETRSLTVTTELSDDIEYASERDIFQERVLNLSKSEGEAFQNLRREQLIQYQEERLIDPALETFGLPTGLSDLLKEVLADTQRYTYNGDTEALSAYEDQAHRLTAEQVQTYLGDAAPDYYSWGQITCAYLVDLDRDGREELSLFYDSGGTAGFSDMDIWRLTADSDPELLHTFPMQRGTARLLDYKGAYYFVAPHYNFYTRETTGFYVLTADTDNTLQLYSLNLENKENQKRWIETYRNENMEPRLEQSLATYIESIKRDVEEKTVSNDDYQLIDGNAETPYQESDTAFPLDAFSNSQYDKKCCRVVDLDNDGSVECVRKSIWYPSSLSSTLGMTVELYKEYESYVHLAQICFPFFASTGSYADDLGTVVSDAEIFTTIPVQLWFQTFDQKVYTFCVNRISGSSDYLLEVSLIEGEQLHPLLQYLLIAEKKYTFEKM